VISALVLVAVFFAGTGVGYFFPQVFGSSTTPNVTQVCPPCPELIETEDGVAECPQCPTVDPATETPDELETLFAPFWETWDIVHDEYVDQPVDDLTLMRGAIEGMLASLGDRHTSYMDPDEYQQANEALEGEYEGIGAWVDITGEFVEIVSPMRGSPADEAGLQPKDKVIGIDGEDLTDVPGDLVLQRILGPAGTDVTLTIQRGDEVFDVTITRANIIVPTADYELLEDDIAYIGLYNYGDRTADQLRESLREMRRDGAEGLIFDLRGNGGGYLNIAIQVVSEFIGEGVVMYEQYGDGETLAYEALSGGLATEIPMVVLVDAGTASASEITAGAIQDYGRAPLVGVTTFGKGSVQTWVALDNNAGGVRVTIARWLTPDQRQISEVGLEPEYIVEMTEEDYAEDNDLQLDKAIEVLKDLIEE
jgi:carboxyl-terminal processing protease